MNPCLSCGSDVGDDNPPNPQHCGNCPPTRCDDCGGVCDWQSGALCSCWIDLQAMPIADVKALFAEYAPDLSLDPVVAPKGDEK